MAKGLARHPVRRPLYLGVMKTAFTRKSDSLPAQHLPHRAARRVLVPANREKEHRGSVYSKELTTLVQDTHTMHSGATADTEDICQ
jgi:hypothetical protein